MILDKEKILLENQNESLNTPNEYISHDDERHEKDVITQKEWLCQNIPFIKTPDTLLDRVYYYRWKNLLACLAKRRDGKYEFCESAPGSYYHKYIDCAQGAHLREARWIKNTKYLNDYIDSTPDKEAYRNYFLDSVYQKYLLDREEEVLRRNFQKFAERFNSRRDFFDADMGLYFAKGDNEGQEAGTNCFDFVEKFFKYEASFTSPDSSVDFLTDNDVSGAFWSCRGTKNKLDSISISIPFPDFHLTGVRLWFKKVPKDFNVFYLNEGKRDTVNSLSHYTDERNMTLVSFDKVQTEKVKIEFENDGFTEIYELVLCYNFEPWGSENFWKVIGGEESFRVCSNAFMASAAFALSKIASVISHPSEDDFRRAGEELRENILSKLWNDEEKFFDEILRSGERVSGKESASLSPWSFSLVPDEEKYASAWEYAVSDEHFRSTFGITSLEKNNPHYLQPFIHGCLWNGPVWPYTFSLILTGMANVLHCHENRRINKEDYFDLLKRYCRCHFDNYSTEAFAVREDHHPEENRWLAQAREYNHSTFTDNVLSGLFGIRPEKTGLVVDPIVPDEWEHFCVDGVMWGGKEISVLYDKYGKVYNTGCTFCVFVDGKKAFEGDKITKITITL